MSLLDSPLFKLAPQFLREGRTLFATLNPYRQSPKDRRSRFILERTEAAARALQAHFQEWFAFEVQAELMTGEVDIEKRPRNAIIRATLSTDYNYSVRRYDEDLLTRLGFQEIHPMDWNFPCPHLILLDERDIGIIRGALQAWYTSDLASRLGRFYAMRLDTRLNKSCETKEFTDTYSPMIDELRRNPKLRLLVREILQGSLGEDKVEAIQEPSSHDQRNQTISRVWMSYRKNRLAEKPARGTFGTSPSPRRRTQEK